MKYYGTIGPACADSETLSQMLAMGMNGIRLNLSHGSLMKNINYVKLIQDHLLNHKEFKDFLIDLQGPELRIGDLEHPLELVKDSIVDIPKIPEILFSNITSGQELLLDDGKILVQVLEPGKGAGTLKCRVLRGGLLQSRKSIACKGLNLNLPTLTSEDWENIALAKSYGVTSVMLPFVRNSQDIRNLRQALNAHNGSDIEIYAKIESLAGFQALEEFIDEADHIVIARGDLGNAVALWELPGLQHRIEEVCKAHGKPYMVVTQMLNSMIEHPIPTRAEVNDVYLAVFNGASSIMLTGETAAGKYPAEAVKYLVKTGEEARKDRMLSDI